MPLLGGHLSRMNLQAKIAILGLIFEEQVKWLAPHPAVVQVSAYHHGGQGSCANEQFLVHGSPRSFEFAVSGTWSIV